MISEMSCFWRTNMGREPRGQAEFFCFRPFRPGLGGGVGGGSSSHPDSKTGFRPLPPALPHHREQPGLKPQDPSSIAQPTAQPLFTDTQLDNALSIQCRHVGTK